MPSHITRMGYLTQSAKQSEWLANQMHQAVSLHKERLPSKARKFKYPTILWALIPYHDIYGHYNEFKAKYNKVVKHIVSLFREMDTLSLKSWISSELSYFSDGRINSFGLSSYWQSVSDAFKEWDRNQMKLNQGTLQISLNKGKSNTHFKKFFARPPGQSLVDTTKRSSTSHHFDPRFKNGQSIHWSKPS